MKRELYNNVNCIILTGGKSSRMGTDKSFLKIGSETMIQRMKNLLSNIFKNVFLSTNDFDPYSGLQLTMIEDIYRDKGPLSGIHAALKFSSTQKNFIISCDLPFVTEDAIKYLVEYASQKPILIPSAGNRMQQLCGIYSKSLVPAIEKIFNESDSDIYNAAKRGVSVQRLIEYAGAEIINMERLPFYNENIFFNMNSEADYNFVKSIVRN